MANKRLTFDIPESLHSRLKAEAAVLGISLGSHCTAILEGQPEQSGSPSIEKLDTSQIEAMSLQSLREISVALNEKKPKDWKTKLGNINTEIRRRYRI